MQNIQDPHTGLPVGILSLKALGRDGSKCTSIPKTTWNCLFISLHGKEKNQQHLNTKWCENVQAHFFVPTTPRSTFEESSAFPLRECDHLVSNKVGASSSGGCFPHPAGCTHQRGWKALSLNCSLHSQTASTSGRNPLGTPHVSKENLIGALSCSFLNVVFLTWLKSGHVW